MKIHFSLATLFSLQGTAKGSVAGSPRMKTFKPLKIPFASLTKDELSEVEKVDLGSALQNVGMVSITEIPNLKQLKNAVMSWNLHACTQESPAAVSHHYADGTHRSTIATHTVPGGTPTIQYKSDSLACRSFDEASVSFRAVVDEVTLMFASKVSSLLRNRQDGAFLTTPSDFPFATFSDIVEHGEHLEHFHSYQRVQDGYEDARSAGSTIDFHTDQGLFLVFSPGQLAYQDPTVPNGLGADFTIELRDGSQAAVEFTEEDGLVILLGDGVNQYINPRMDANHALRSLPHALSLPVSTHEVARVWYGRMVLPPASAVHPQHGRSFDDLRSELISASTGSGIDAIETLSLGCASNTHVARQLEDTSCNSSSLMCWHKCMSLAQFNVSDAVCADQGKQVYCINPRGQLWDGNHGDFYPGCATNDTEIATPFTTLPDYPRDEAICTNESFTEFATAMPYDHQIDLGGSGAVFLWNVSDGHVLGRIAFNGLLGFLAIGLANVGGEKNGMHGAHILMAIPGGNYSAITGFDLSIEPSIHEYQISPNPEQSSFRFWGVNDGTTATARHADATSELNLTNCFSSFTFEAEDIKGIPFNLSGVDQLLWSANNIDSYAGYHGMNRGRFSVDWPSGKAELYQAAPEGAPTSASRTIGLGASLGFLIMVLSILSIQ